MSSAYALCFSIDGHQLYAGYRQMIRIFDVERPGRVSRDIYTFSKLKLMLNDGNMVFLFEIIVTKFVFLNRKRIGRSESDHIGNCNESSNARCVRGCMLWSSGYYLIIIVANSNQHICFQWDSTRIIQCPSTVYSIQIIAE